MGKSFTGRLWLALEPQSAVDATATIESGHLVIVAGDSEIVNWETDQVHLVPRNDGFLLQSSGEDLSVRPHQSRVR